MLVAIAQSTRCLISLNVDAEPAPGFGDLVGRHARGELDDLLEVPAVLEEPAMLTDPACARRTR